MERTNHIRSPDALAVTAHLRNLWFLTVAYTNPATRRAIAMLAVMPGDSMPPRWM